MISKKVGIHADLPYFHLPKKVLVRSDFLISLAKISVSGIPSYFILFFTMFLKTFYRSKAYVIFFIFQFPQIW